MKTLEASLSSPHPILFPLLSRPSGAAMQMGHKVCEGMRPRERPLEAGWGGQSQSARLSVAPDWWSSIL